MCKVWCLLWKWWCAEKFLLRWGCQQNVSIIRGTRKILFNKVLCIRLRKVVVDLIWNWSGWMQVNCAVWFEHWGRWLGWFETENVITQLDLGLWWNKGTTLNTWKHEIGVPSNLVGKWKEKTKSESQWKCRTWFGCLIVLFWFSIIVHLFWVNPSKSIFMLILFNSQNVKDWFLASFVLSF